MTYEEALTFIHTRIHLGTHKGLSRMRRLMEKLGDPQKQLRFIHIAGSNGKGSTATMCESVLRAAGYTTGLFVSPYVFDFRERIQVNGALVEQAQMTAVLEQMLPVLAEMKAEDQECTEFEVVTALSICVFAQAKVNVVVFEVGIGGLLDCTNIIPPPEVAVLTAVSLEHTDILGKTIPEIAAQKCGIIKPGCRVAAYCSLPEEALQVLSRTCAEAGIRPRIADLSHLSVLSCTAEGSRIRYENVTYQIPLVGEHQISNALTVLSIVEELREKGYCLPVSAVQAGLAQTVFAGRLQTVRTQPLCILDGAHNPGKMSSLAQAIDRFYQGRRIIAVMGMMARKDYEHSIPLIAQRCHTLIAVTPDSPLALPAEETARVARQSPGCRVLLGGSPRAGAALALSLAQPEDVLIACGSLYLLGDAKTGFLGGN